MTALDTTTLDVTLIAALTAAQHSRPGFDPTHYTLLADVLDSYDPDNEYATVLFTDASGQQVAVSNNDVPYMLASIQHEMQSIAAWETLQ